MARRRKSPKLNLPGHIVQTLAGLLLILFGVLVVVSFTGQGVLLQAVNQYLLAKLGLSLIFLPYIFVSAGLIFFNLRLAWTKPHNLLGAILVMIGFAGLFSTGDIGTKTFVNLATLLSVYGALATFFTTFVAGLIIMMQLSITDIEKLFAQSGKKKSADKQVDSNDVVEKSSRLSLPLFGKAGAAADKEMKVIDNSAMLNVPDVTGKAVDMPAAAPASAASGSDSTDLENTKHLQPLEQANLIWEYPPLSLLSNVKGGKADRGDVKGNAQIIESTFRDFGIGARVKEANLGPSVTQYAIEIDKGTKLSRITGLANDMALALSAPTGQIRIEAPIAGRNLVGIEVPNHSPEFVTLRTMLASDQMRKHKSKLAVALGINVAGEKVVADIASMPHVLIAGSTGSGKSVAINAFMCSMLFRASPAEVRFILVDPKRVELTGYNNIPHLLTPVIVDASKVVSALKWATAEMDRRYKLLAEVGVKNVDSYNELAGINAMYRIVILIDELADVMLFAPAEVEECITRIAQMARAVGIHLVLATQRPSVDVLTGLIKANIPTRLAFNVSSMTDSRVILDSPGAEKLLGKGDMLFMPPELSKPVRIQGTYVSDRETADLISFIKAQGQEPNYEEDITTKFKSSTIKGGAAGQSEDRDALFVPAAQMFAQQDKASSSLIQRRLSVGYARAARILDQLYAAGLVGPAEGSKPRDINHQNIRAFLASLESSGE